MKQRSKLYEFFSGTDEYIIFARSKLKARAMYEAVKGSEVLMPPGWGGLEIEAWQRTGRPEQIELICAGGWEGIGIPLDYRNMWTVLPMPREVW